MKDKFSYQSQKILGNILITSASRKIPLIEEMKKAANKSFSGMKVIAGDMDNKALSRYVSDEFWCMPQTVDTEIDELLAGCKKHGIGIIYPTRDGELMFWSKNKLFFAKNGIKVLVSSPQSINLCFDKLYFSEFGQKADLPIIPSAQNPDELGTGPFVVKERYGAGARKIGLNLESRNQALEHGLKLEYPIYQPFITGKEVSIDAWVYQNYQVKGLVMRTRDLIINGESQVTTTFRNDRVETEVKNLLTALKLYGHVVMQIIIDIHNKIHVIECNPRFGGASTISIAAGLDTLYWSLLDASGEDLEKYQFDRIHGEVRQIRVPHDRYIYDSYF